MKFFLSGLISLLVTCSTASAGVVYDTLGPNNSFLSASYIVGNIEGATPTAYNYISANYFIPTDSGYLSSIAAPVVLLPFSIAAPIQFEIRANSDGKPGAIIASSLIDLTSSSSPRIYTATFAGTTFLDASTPYWLSMSATYAGTAASWQVNSLGARTLHAYTGVPAFPAPNQWNVFDDRSAAARISVITAVPEVSPSLMLLLGLPLLLIVARKRPKSERGHATD